MKSVTLECGGKVSVVGMRRMSDARNDGQTHFLPYVDINYEGEIYTKYDGEDVDCGVVNIPIQLRSLDALIDLLIELRDELKK